MYDNVEDARRYLDGSVIRYGKKPILVHGCYVNRKSVTLEVSYLRTEKRENIAINDPLLNFKPVPLGYGVDVRGDIHFHFRIPRRRWKQGLHPESVGVSGGAARRISFGSRGERLSLANTIQGRFKTFKQAFKEGGIFHRNFQIAMRNGGRFLEYRGERIGSFDGNTLELYDKYSYMDKYVEEVMA